MKCIIKKGVLLQNHIYFFDKTTPKSCLPLYISIDRSINYLIHSYVIFFTYECVQTKIIWSGDQTGLFRSFDRY